jgi:hypothetical protein
MGKGTILNQFQCLQFRTQLMEGLLDFSFLVGTRFFKTRAIVVQLLLIDTCQAFKGWH